MAQREIWIVHRSIPHYRLPLLDRLSLRLGQQGFTLKVVFDANIKDGPAYQIRPYCDPFIRVKESALFGFDYWLMPDLLRAIRRRRPAAVIVDGTPRIVTNFRVPSVTRAAGGLSFLWAKGHAEETTPSGVLTDQLRARFTRLFDGVICYGREGKRDLERIGISSDRITIAQNTIDTDRIFAEIENRETRALEAKQRYGLEGRRIVLYCSTMYPKKRHLDLVEAWPMIRAVHPDAVLVMVGGGPMYEAVESRVAQIGRDDIRLLGSVPEGDDYMWIGAADVSVMCGGLGLAIQQSLAFGRPMVVADEPGVDGELVRHGDTGWRYPRGNLPALAETVNAVLEDPEGSALIAQRGHDLIRNHASLDMMADGFIKALNSAGIVPEAHDAH